jgi:hypothetical protein
MVSKHSPTWISHPKEVLPQRKTSRPRVSFIEARRSIREPENQKKIASQISIVAITKIPPS